MHTDAITLHTDDGLAKRLEEAAGQPVVIEHNGVRYRIEPEDPFAFYDPEKMRAAIHAGAGAFKGIDREQFLADIREARGHGPETDEEHRAYFRQIVREVKPGHLPTEYGPESRYGRDSHSNGRYNEALDEYEAALLKRIDTDE
ncbi:MAG: hypothetical protein M3Y58_21250 [Chloroflexota bacterium]|nr:hypothetical protein [Chloroflexota bacterium]